MPVSPDRPLRGRTRRRAAGFGVAALVALALAPAARAADREITVSATTPQAWQGRAALTTTLLDPATLAPCGGTAADVCDSTLLHVDGAGTLAVKLATVDAGTPDVDLYVYRSDPFGLAGPLVGVSIGPATDEAVDVPTTAGTYLVQAASFSAGSSGYAGTATLTPSPTAPPDVDHPRGRKAALVSAPLAGAASQPVAAASPRDHHLLVAAYRVFGDPAMYVSR